MINLTVVEDNVTITVSEVGPTGPAGAPGQGVPVGGTAGQILAKVNSTNYNTEWINNTDLTGLTSVGLSMPTGFTVSNSPLTANGTLGVTLSSGYVIPTQSALNAKVPYTGATTDLDLGTHDLKTNKVFLYDEVNDNYASIHYSDSDFHIEDADGDKLLVIEDGFMQLHLTDTIQSNLYTTQLTQTRDHYLPNASGTLALTSQIPNLSGVAPVVYNSGNGQISMAAANGTVPGYLTTTDWNFFNEKVSSTRSIGTTAPLQGGGNLTTNRTLSITQADISTDGYLSYQDWNTFNNKANTSIQINPTAPLTGGGTLASNVSIGITAVSPSSDGYLTSTDYNEFKTSIKQLGTQTTGYYTIYTGTNQIGDGIIYQSGGTLFLPSSVNQSGLGNSRAVVTDGSGNTVSATIGNGLTLSGGVLSATGTASGSIGGSGTINFVPKFTGTAAIDNSLLFDNGTNIGISTTTIGSKLQVNGNAAIGYSASTAAPSNGLTVNGNTLIGTSTDAGFRLDVNGTSRLNGLQTFRGTTVSNGGQVGAELLTSSGWTSTGWTGDYVTGFTHTTGNTTALLNSLAAVTNNSYTITYTITGRTAGTITPSFGGVTQPFAATSSSGYSFRATSTASLVITPTSDFDGTVVISVKQITAGSATTTFQNSAGTTNIEVRASGLFPTTNTFIGLNSGRFITSNPQVSPTGNTAFGSNALSQLLAGTNNTAIGNNAGANISSGGANTLIGNGAGSSITTGFNNAVIGNTAGNALTTGFNNIVIGNTAGQSLTTQGSSVFIGTQAGLNASNTAAINVFIGTNTGLGITTGDGNAIVGHNVRMGSTSSFNAILGKEACNVTGNNNVAIGWEAGRKLANGTIAGIANNSIFIGYDTRQSANDQTNQIVIGYNQSGLGSNTTIIGNSSTTITGLFGNLRLASGMATAPASATATGTTGDIRVTATHIYVCSATNTWVRTALSTW